MQRTLHVETHQASALLHKVGHGALALGQQLIDGDGLHAEGLGCLTAGGVLQRRAAHSHPSGNSCLPTEDCWILCDVGMIHALSHLAGMPASERARARANERASEYTRGRAGANERASERTRGRAGGRQGRWREHALARTRESTCLSASSITWRPASRRERARTHDRAHSPSGRPLPE
jgi:hypothetical protein